MIRIWEYIKNSAGLEDDNAKFIQEVEDATLWNKYDNIKDAQTAIFYSRKCSS